MIDNVYDIYLKDMDVVNIDNAKMLSASNQKTFAKPIIFKANVAIEKAKTDTVYSYKNWESLVSTSVTPIISVLKCIYNGTSYYKLFCSQDIRCMLHGSGIELESMTLSNHDEIFNTLNSIAFILNKSNIKDIVFINKDDAISYTEQWKDNEGKQEAYRIINKIREVMNYKIEKLNMQIANCQKTIKEIQRKLDE